MTALNKKRAAYTRQLTGSALFKVMACGMFDAKPLPEPTPAYSRLESWEQIAVKFESLFYHFIHLKFRHPEWRLGEMS